MEHNSGAPLRASDDQLVRFFYNQDPDREWLRTQQNPYHSIEPAVVWRATLDDALKSPSRVLDVGCGPGVYAVELARRGHSVMLVDVSSSCLDYALAMFRAEGMTDRLLGVQNVSAEKMDVAEGDYDLVLLFGPLYHLLESTDALSCIRLAREALRPGGSLVATFITRHSIFKDLLKRGKFSAIRTLVADGYAESGIFRPQSEEAVASYMPPTRTYHLTEARGLFEAANLAIVDALSLEGWAAFMAPYINQVADSQDAFNRMIETIYEGVRLPEVIEAGDHFLIHAKRPMNELSRLGMP